MTKLGQINNLTEMYDKSEVDGIISALPTGGDMLKSVYDTDNDGIVNQADVITDVLIKLNTNNLPLSDIKTYKKYLANLRKVISDRVVETLTK